jgi:hypothetical protein
MLSFIFNGYRTMLRFVATLLKLFELEHGGRPGKVVADLPLPLNLSPCDDADS